MQSKPRLVSRRGAAFCEPHDDFGPGILLEFLRAKLAASEQALRAREQAGECWGGGTSKSWREVGCRMTKPQRLLVSEKEGRIAERYRREIAMFRAIIAIVERK